MGKESDTLRINFDCGKANITLQNWQGHVFDFYQDFDLNEEIILHSDSLKIIYKGQDYKCEFVGENTKSSELIVTGNRTVRTAFSIEQKVNAGDTITVIQDGYIYCNHKKVKKEELRLIMTQDLRGPLGS